ncbi:restriction endonuclease subunit S [Acidipropionibacterium jensenii]|uniref:Restriction endonuclease subunit S n=1 Tax=Acidipropionibacterium jensenii TaxID=1749 RepID=A0A3T0S143_9ACTN|nr:restriction endonuclease subunit S [Acidipropionibacterium jensenii]AZZ40115.1 restriction endonuclease subunit S [Acidipropionibacterium jensenii]
MSCTLADCCSSIDYGFTQSSSDEAVGPHFLRITDIDSESIDWDSVPYCEASLEESNRYSLSSGDIVVARTGASTGNSRYIDSPGGAVFASYLVRLKPRPGVNSRYLSYVLKSARWKHYVSSIANSKSAQPNMSASAMGGFSFNIHLLSEQQAIAEVLGALDDKIAANRKLITTTLDLVQALHDQLSGSGEVTSTLYTNVAEVGGGATPKTRVPEYWDGNIRWASPTDITALEAPYLHDTSRHITQTGLDSCSSPLYPAGSILMTSRATIGAFAVAQEPTAVNQGFIVLIPKREELRWWLLHDMTGRVKEFENRANGATFLELSKRVFRTMEFNLPPEVQLRRFDESACALHEHAISLGQESQTLASLRDTLLPALMDGTIRVKDAETHVEEVL